MTKMKEALEKAGYSKADMQAAMWAAAFIELSGTREGWIAAYDAAELRRVGQSSDVQEGRYAVADATNPIQREGQSQSVQQDQTASADPLNPMRQEGQLRVDQQVHGSAADLSQPMPGAGQSRNADDGHSDIVSVRQPITSGGGHHFRAQTGHSGAAPAARDPTDAYLKAAAASRQQTARTLLDLRKTSAGKWWGDVRPEEFPGMKRDGEFVKAVEGILGPLNAKQQAMTLRELMSPNQIGLAFTQMERACA